VRGGERHERQRGVDEAPPPVCTRLLHPGALTVVGEDWGEDGCRGKEDVEPGYAAEDEVEEQDEARVIVIIFVVWCGGSATSLLDCSMRTMYSSVSAAI
jgi:hypothetical protein